MKGRAAESLGGGDFESLNTWSVSFTSSVSFIGWDLPLYMPPDDTNT
jgi:hypothetical protein